MFQQRNCITNSSAAGKGLAPSGPEGTPMGLERGELSTDQGSGGRGSGADRGAGRWGLAAALLR